MTATWHVARIATKEPLGEVRDRLLIRDVQLHNVAEAATREIANLIAAAPDLLAKLKELVDLSDAAAGDGSWRYEARVVIAKAEGKSGEAS